MASLIEKLLEEELYADTSPKRSLSAHFDNLPRHLIDVDGFYMLNPFECIGRDVGEDISLAVRYISNLPYSHSDLCLEIDRYYNSERFHINGKTGFEKFVTDLAVRHIRKVKHNFGRNNKGALINLGSESPPITTESEIQKIVAGQPAAPAPYINKLLLLLLN